MVAEGRAHHRATAVASGCASAKHRRQDPFIRCETLLIRMGMFQQWGVCSAGPKGHTAPTDGCCPCPSLQAQQGARPTRHGQASLQREKGARFSEALGGSERGRRQQAKVSKETGSIDGAGRLGCGSVNSWGVCREGVARLRAAPPVHGGMEWHTGRGRQSGCYAARRLTRWVRMLTALRAQQPPHDPAAHHPAAPAQQAQGAHRT